MSFYSHPYFTQRPQQPAPTPFHHRPECQRVRFAPQVYSHPVHATPASVYDQYLVPSPAPATGAPSLYDVLPPQQLGRLNRVLTQHQQRISEHNRLIAESERVIADVHQAIEDAHDRAQALARHRGRERQRVMQAEYDQLCGDLVRREHEKRRQQDLVRQQREHEERRQRGLVRQQRQEAARRRQEQVHINLDAAAFEQWIGSMFGVQLPAESEPEVPAPAPAQEKAKEKVATPTEAVPTPSPSSDKPAAAAVDDKTKTPTLGGEAPKFPEAINDILSTILGLRVEPESKSDAKASTDTGKVPSGLNELLAPFGLEFFPDTEDKPEPARSTSTQDSTAAPAASSSTAPETDAKSPFDLSLLRDILGNVGLAYEELSELAKEEAGRGKGKSVAKGEKVTSPPTEAQPEPQPLPQPPVPSSAEAPQPEPERNIASESLAKLESIGSQFRQVVDSFTFPTSLSFSPTSSLLYNKRNMIYHSQNHKLLQLLLAADGIASNGDKCVRSRRKQVVREIEGEIQGLERKKDELWEEVKERRERDGVSADDEEDWSSASGSERGRISRDEVEHVEQVSPGEEVVSNELADAQFPAEAVNAEPVQPEKKEAAEKDEGYELL